MKEVSIERLEKDVRRVLENPFWLSSLSADTYYERIHDDHDGTFTGKISVSFDRMGDAWVEFERPKGVGQCLRFRTFGGGGRSLRVRNALMILAEAIRLDDEENPERPEQL